MKYLWWAAQVLCLLISIFFFIFGIDLIRGAYGLNDPFSFIMTFFAASFIILISLTLSIVFIIKMIRGLPLSETIQDPGGEILMTVLVSVKELCKAYGDDTLFTDLTVDVKPGEKLGLIGMNGSGKSTLLKIICGLSAPDEGEVGVQTGLSLVYLAQEDKFDTDLTIGTGPV